MESIQNRYYSYKKTDRVHNKTIIYKVKKTITIERKYITMCTALTLTTREGYHLFGRNMDIECSFNQSVQLVPRNFSYINKATHVSEKIKYAMIGTLQIFINIWKQVHYNPQILNGVMKN